MNGSTSVSPSALESVQRAIADLNYVPNRAARSLASRQTQAIAPRRPRRHHDVLRRPVLRGDRVGHQRTAARGRTTSSTSSSRATTRATRRPATCAAAPSMARSSCRTTRATRSSTASPPPFPWSTAAGRCASASATTTSTSTTCGAGGMLSPTSSSEVTGASPRSRAPSRCPPASTASHGYRQALAAAGLEEGLVEDGGFTVDGGAEAMRRILDRGRPARRDLRRERPHGPRRADGARQQRASGFRRTSRSSASTTRPSRRRWHPQLTTMRQPSFQQGEMHGEQCSSRSSRAARPSTSRSSTPSSSSATRSDIGPRSRAGGRGFSIPDPPVERGTMAS